MRTLIHERVDEANAGTNPKVIRKVEAGWVVIGDVQFLEGYCLLLPDPVVPDLNALQGKDRTVFLETMTKLGDAILEVTGAARINYEILGNTEPALHAHVFPRFLSEDPSLVKRPVWFYDWHNAPKFDEEKHGDIKAKIGNLLDQWGLTVG